MGGNRPNLGKDSLQPLGIAQSLFSKVQLKVLGLLFGQPDRQFQMAELISLVDSGVGATSRVVTRLVRSGLVIRKPIGRRTLYQANRASPVFPEIHSFVMKTVGLTDLIREVLGPHMENIWIAFIFGSVATGRDDSDSDIDVFIIGDSLPYGQILPAMQPVEKTVGRRISIKIVTHKEWQSKVVSKNPFVLNMLSQPKIFLKGSDGELGPA